MEKIDYFCIGAPQIIGDSIGPLIGSFLQRGGYYVVGTIEDPVTRKTFESKLKELRKGAYVIVIDAAVGDAVGTYSVFLEGLRPGLAMDDPLESVGTLSIKCYTAATVDNLLTADRNMIIDLAHKVTTAILAGKIYHS